MEPSEQRVFGDLRNGLIAPEEKLSDGRVAALNRKRPAEHFVLKKLRCLDEAEPRLDQQMQEVPEDIPHVKTEGGVKEAGQGKGYLIGLDLG